MTRGRNPCWRDLPARIAKIPYFGGLWNEKAHTPTACHHDCQVKHLRVERDSEGLTCQYVYRRRKQCCDTWQGQEPLNNWCSNVWNLGHAAFKLRKKRAQLYQTSWTEPHPQGELAQDCIRRKNMDEPLGMRQNYRFFSFVSFSGQWIPYIYILRYYMVLLSHLFQSMTHTDTMRPLNCLSHLGSYKSNSGQSPLQQTILSTDVDFETASVAD